MAVLFSTKNVPIKNLNSSIKKIGIVFCLVIGIPSSFAQNQSRLDSLKQAVLIEKDTTQVITYMQIVANLIYVDPLDAKPYLDTALVKAKALKNDDIIARTTNLLGVYYNFTSQYKKGDSIFDIALDMYKKLEDSIVMSYVLNNKALALSSMGRFRTAIETHMQALRLKEQINDTEESIAASYWNIGNLQGDVGNYDASNDYYEKAKAIYTKLNLEQDLKSVENNMAINLHSMGRPAEAIPLLLKAIAYNKKNNLNNDLAGTYDSLGSAYFSLDSIAKAKDYFQKSLAISKNYGETSLEGLNYRHLGDVALKESKPKLALDYFKRSLRISEETNTRKKIITDYLRLATTYALLGNYKSAYENHVTYHKIHDEILNKENIERINELEIQYQTERREKELIIKENRIKLLEERRQKGETQKIFLIITLIGAIAFAISVVYGLRQKMKRNKIEREKLDKDLEFKEKELTTHALHLAHKNEVLLELKTQLKALKADSNNARKYQSIINNINLDINNDSNWDQFRNYFEDVHKDFNSKVMRNYPEVSNNDLRLMSLLKMNLSSKEIANILNISVEGVKKARYRLRKKLNLSTEDSLQELVIEL